MGSNQNQFLRIKNYSTKNSFMVKFLGNFLMQEFCTFLKPAQNCASFDTLGGQFLEKICNSYDLA
jgi:hypothetical protein